MYLRLLVPLVVVLAAPSWGRAAVIVLANYTDGTVVFRVAQPGGKVKEHKLPSNHVEPLFVVGPTDLAFATRGQETKHRLDMYNAYVFLPDDAGGLKLEGIELPGAPLERDARAELNPVPRDPPVKVPVTLLVDDSDPRADRAWQADLRKRFGEAAEVLEKGTGIKFTLAGFDTWKSDPRAQTTADLLTGLEKAVPVKPGALAVGYTSRRIDPKADPAFGSGGGLSGRHLLLREWVPKSETERTEVLIHFLAKALGGISSPDPGSALRPSLGNGYALRRGAVLRLDPLNALLLNLWADERRREPTVTLDSLSADNRSRMTRLYKALLKAAPGDSLAIVYLETLERDVAKALAGEAPKAPAGEAPKAPRVQVDTKARDAVARAVVKAVRERAAANAAAGNALKGDALTAEYVSVAAEAALRSPGPAAAPGFLIGLGIALDDSGALSDDALTSDAVGALETADERRERLAVLGNPTLARRRDLCRRFFVGGAVGILAPDGAENAAVGRVTSDFNRPANACLSALAAEFGGIAFARAVIREPNRLYDFARPLAAADYLPPMKGLRDGLSAEKFLELYGGTSDKRFLAVLDDIRARLREMEQYK